MDLDFVGAAPFGVGQNGFDLDQRLLGGARHRHPAPGADQPGAGDQGNDFVSGEHQRRQVISGPQDITDTRLAIDRHAARLEVGDVAVDRALGNLQGLGQPGRREQPTAPQELPI